MQLLPFDACHGKDVESQGLHILAINCGRSSDLLFAGDMPPDSSKYFCYCSSQTCFLEVHLCSVRSFNSLQIPVVCEVSLGLDTTFLKWEVMFSDDSVMSCLVSLMASLLPFFFFFIELLALSSLVWLCSYNCTTQHIELVCEQGTAMRKQWCTVQVCFVNCISEAWCEHTHECTLVRLVAFHQGAWQRIWCCQIIMVLIVFRSR